MEKVRILCFGNSLTEGYSQWGMSFTPYAENMKARLDAAWLSTKVTVDVEGKSGDMIVPPGGEFLRRIKKRCQNPEVRYDWIIILGGTNDLGHGRQPNAIWSGLQKIYEIALDHGANILALTIPECAAKIRDLDRRRDELNTLIKEHKAERFYVLDLHALMPYHGTSKESRYEIWDDGLHFTPHGYSVMGDHIANKLVALLVEMSDVEKKNLSGEDSEVMKTLSSKGAEE